MSFPPQAPDVSYREWLAGLAMAALISKDWDMRDGLMSKELAAELAAHFADELIEELKKG